MICLTVITQGYITRNFQSFPPLIGLIIVVLSLIHS